MQFAKTCVAEKLEISPFMSFVQSCFNPDKTHITLECVMRDFKEGFKAVFFFHRILGTLESLLCMERLIMSYVRWIFSACDSTHLTIFTTINY